MCVKPKDGSTSENVCTTSSSRLSSTSDWYTVLIEFVGVYVHIYVNGRLHASEHRSWGKLILASSGFLTLFSNDHENERCVLLLLRELVFFFSFLDDAWSGIWSGIC